MSQMYILIKILCKNQGISIAEMCRRVGIRQGLISDLKNGHSQSLKAENLHKLANYFGVPMEYFLYGPDVLKEKEEKKTPEPITTDQLLFALYGEVPEEITDEDMEDIKKYAAFVRQRKLNNKED